ncbi:carbohydrate-binding module family 13 protein [Macrolepiota fuliginosa MF-IS2]|uniref:Carbohydrate-binding module family 13 protein n=1 Tax=Macrolepiota fuliginosa MF-IS2 TaxID=1400762 RepID=A0A9P5X4Z1_9AGAR|nr:carbohydrate-binding module family 13 protein [Macrolepiota fuliginosa MF-IS2]
MFAKLYLTLLAFSAVVIAQDQPSYIRNSASAKVLDVDGGSRQPGANVILWDRKPSGSDNQLWSYGNRYLVNKNSGLVLEAPLADGGLQPGTPVQQAVKRNGASNQLWIYDRQYRLVSAYDSSLCVWGLDGNVQDPGTKAVVDICIDGEVTQEWMLDTP